MRRAGEARTQKWLTATGSGEQHWILGVRVSLRALLDGLAASPELARPCAAVQLRAVGRRDEASRGAVLERLGSLLSPAAGEPAGASISALSARMLADDVLDTIGRTVLVASPAALPSLLVQLQWWVVTLRST